MTATGLHRLKLAADLDVMWSDVPVLDRIEAAGNAGFQGVALSAPYDMPAKELQRAALRSGAALVRIATPPPNYTGGDRGFAAAVDGEMRFQHDLRRAQRYCTALQVHMLQLLAGPGQSLEAQNTLHSNLEHAADAAPAWMQFVIGPEPQAESALPQLQTCLDLLDAIKSRQLAVQLPCALDTDSLTRARHLIEQYGPRIAALVIDAKPGDSGSVSAGAFAQGVADAGFKGWVMVALSSAPLDWISED